MGARRATDGSSNMYSWYAVNNSHRRQVPIRSNMFVSENTIQYGMVYRYDGKSLLFFRYGTKRRRGTREESPK